MTACFINRNGVGRFAVLVPSKKVAPFLFHFTSKREFEACGGHDLMRYVEETWPLTASEANDAMVFHRETAKTEMQPCGANTCKHCFVTVHGHSDEEWLQCDRCNGFDHRGCATQRGETYLNDEPYFCPLCREKECKNKNKNKNKNKKMKTKR
jgi:hypothetical protein